MSKWRRFLCWLGFHSSETTNEYDELENVMYTEAICKHCGEQTYFHEDLNFYYRGK